MSNPHITALEELLDWLRKQQSQTEMEAALPNAGSVLARQSAAFFKRYADAIDTALSLLAERVAERQKPLFEMSLAELQSLRGRVDSFIHFKVCGDPRIGVSFPVSAAPQPLKGEGTETKFPSAAGERRAEPAPSREGER